MATDIRSPSERAQDEDDNWQFDTNQFEEGPDNWNQETREGWRLYLVENIPYRGVYALCRYSWKTDREDTIVDIGTVNVEPMITSERVNEVFRENGIQELTDSQYRVIYEAYKDCLTETLRNATLEKGFQICDHTMYFQAEDWTEYLGRKIRSTNEEINRIKQMVEDNEVPEYMEESRIDTYTSLEQISDNYMENLDLIEEAVERPHSDGLEFSQYCEFVGELEFTPLRPFQLRAVELVQNGVFHNNEAVAIVQSLREEDYSQKEIAEKLGKDESTVSKQVSVAKGLTRRARWQSANVTLDGRY